MEQLYVALPQTPEQCQRVGYGYFPVFPPNGPFRLIERLYIGSRSAKNSAYPIRANQFIIGEVCYNFCNRPFPWRGVDQQSVGLSAFYKRFKDAWHLSL